MDGHAMRLGQSLGKRQPKVIQSVRSLQKVFEDRYATPREAHGRVMRADTTNVFWNSLPRVHTLGYALFVALGACDDVHHMSASTRDM